MADDRSDARDRESGSKREQREHREDEGNRGREGFGDDGGTRIGRPTPAAGADDRSHVGPSTHAVDEGLEGAIHDPDRNEGRAPTGMGSEASEGLHGAGSERAEGDVSAAGAAAREKGEKNDPGKQGSGKQGSEPLVHRDTTHSSNYGGEMGEPRK
jgi:hypothetical protein